LFKNSRLKPLIRQSYHQIFKRFFLANSLCVKIGPNNSNGKAIAKLLKNHIYPFKYFCFKIGPNSVWRSFDPNLIFCVLFYRKDPHTETAKIGLKNQNYGEQQPISEKLRIQFGRPKSTRSPSQLVGRYQPSKSRH